MQDNDKAPGHHKDTGGLLPSEFRILGFPDNVKEEKVLDLESGILVSCFMSAPFTCEPQTGMSPLSQFSYWNTRDNHLHLTGIVLTPPGQGTHPSKPQIKTRTSRPLPTLTSQGVELSVCCNWLTALLCGLFLLGEGESRSWPGTRGRGAEKQSSKA